MAASAEGAAWATLLFGLFILHYYFAPVLMAGLWAGLLLGLIGAIAAGAGMRFVSVLGLPGLEPKEKALAGATLGLGVLSLGTFFLGIAHLLAPWAASLMLGAFFFWGYPELRAAALGFRLPEFGSWGAATAACLALLFWMSWVPPHHYDSLVYHLALPQAYVRTGSLAPVEHLLFSHFPQNGEMLFSLALLFRDDILAQLFVWLATALSVGWLWLAAEKTAGAGAARLAALLLATQTSVMLLASTAYVEPLVMLWVSAAIFSYARWEEEERKGWLSLAAIFSGLALGTKYYAGISAAVLGARLLYRRRPRDLALFTAITSAVFSPWLVKNALTVGNPVFPFLYRYFPNTGTGWNAESARGYFHIMVEYGHKGTYLKDLVSLPVLLLRNSLRYGGGMDVLGDLGWELGFWCLPLALWAGKSNRALRGFLVYGAGYFALWFYTGVVLRFLTVVAPLLCLLAACGLQKLWEGLGKGGRAALASGVALLTGAHLLLFFYVHGVFGSERYLLSLEDRQEFLSKRLDYYPCARFAKDHFGENDKILIVGEQRGYYVEEDQVATTVHAPNRYVQWANEARDPRDLAARMKGEGIRHVLLVPSEAKRLGPALGTFTPAGYRNWEGLVPDLFREDFKSRGCIVYSPL